MNTYVVWMLFFVISGAHQDQIVSADKFFDTSKKCMDAGAELSKAFGNAEFEIVCMEGMLILPFDKGNDK